MKLSKRISLIENRIQLVSVISGFLVTLAFLFFSMSLSAAFGYWSYKPEQDVMVNNQFWNVASVGWIVSVFLGCFVSATAAKPVEFRNGILNALTTWAASCLFFGGISMRIADPNLQAFLLTPTRVLFWHGFISDAAALGVAIFAAILAVYIERLKIRVEKEVDVFSSSALLLNNLDPAKY